MPVSAHEWKALPNPLALAQAPIPEPQPGRCLTLICPRGHSWQPETEQGFSSPTCEGISRPAALCLLDRRGARGGLRECQSLEGIKTEPGGQGQPPGEEASRW